jgi:CrcB protein
MKLSPKSIALTFAGGAIGSLSRWLLGESFDMVAMLWAANLVGTFLLGVFNGHSWFATESRREFWAIGFCGGFTTMSGLAAWMYYSTFSLLGLIAMFGLGILVYWFGLKIGTRMAAK